MKIKRELFEIMGAPLKGTNPLPAFRARKYTPLKTDESYPDELKENGCYIAKVLPYLMQDRYTRERETLHLKSFVLENEYLIARFLPEFGGRLHSLYDKQAKRELLFANPVIQPGNVATRNAWLSGGIEWNLGNFGHCYTTCDNMFSVILDDGEGNEFLRIYEFERNKSIFWQVDFHLPDGSPHLFAHVKTVNPFDRATTTYWWTNIAVPIDGTRVLASNKNVMSFISGVAGYERLPYLNALPGLDATYPAKAPRSFDYFIQKNKDGESTWESAAYPDGVVFYERSTAPLYYKKLFVWGNHPAGLNWQHSLSNGEGTGYYAELQAGIAPSQLHDMLMPANTTYEWTQCFGGVKLDADRLFDENYDNAVDYFDTELDKRVTADEINAYDEKFKALAGLTFTEDKILHFGSGFGALEVKRMAIDGDGTPPASMLFPESSIGEAEKPWLSLLNDGKYPEYDSKDLPKSYMVSEKWLPRMREAAKSAPTWFSLLHYGIATYEYSRTDVILRYSQDENITAMQAQIATDAFERSAALCPNVIALRNLAKIIPDKAEYYYDKALALPEALDDFALVSEYLGYLAGAKRYEKAWAIFESLPEKYKRIDRIRIYAAYAAIKLGYFDYLDVFFKEDHCDVREGETALTDVWFEYCALKMAKERGIESPTEEQLDALIDEAWIKCPPNPAIDFRQSLVRNEKYR